MMNPARLTRNILRNSLVLLALLSVVAIAGARAQTAAKPKTPPPPPPKKPAAAAPVHPPPPAHPAPSTTAATTPAPPAGGKAPVPPSAANRPVTPAVVANKSATPTNANAPMAMNRANGGKSVKTPTGATLQYNGRGKATTVTSQSGTVAHFSPSGRISSIQANGTTINRGPRGEQTIITERADHSRVVTTGPNSGYEEHPFTRNGQAYVRRTYVVNGHTYAHVYRGSTYQGTVYYQYVPPTYYAPSFYAWTNSSWSTPVTIQGNSGAWSSSDAYYFQPSATYSDPDAYLTDYVISQNLQAGYESEQQPPNNAPPPPDQSAFTQTQPQTDTTSAPPVLTPELKQAVAVEVQSQVDTEKAAAAAPQAQAASADDSSGGPFVPDALDPDRRTFVVSTALSEPVADGTVCSLTPGDILTRVDDTPDANQNVKVVVSSSQKGDCTGLVAVSTQDLQDMYNRLHELVDSGLNQLAQDQGKNGVPRAPTTRTTVVAADTSQPDPAAQADLQQQHQTAVSPEQDAPAAAGGGSSN
jgi:hypothetical protein